jgi:hypothetical protein
MDSNETVNERRARENAARIAGHQRITARPSVPTRESVIADTRTLYERKEAEGADRIATVRRSQAVDLLRRTLLREPTSAEVDAALERRR